MNTLNKNYYPNCDIHGIIYFQLHRLARKTAHQLFPAAWIIKNTAKKFAFIKVSGQPQHWKKAGKESPVFTFLRYAHASGENVQHSTTSSAMQPWRCRRYPNPWCYRNCRLQRERNIIELNPLTIANIQKCDHGSRTKTVPCIK